MIFEKRGKFCFRDENGMLHKFATEQEAAKAAGLGEQWEFDHGNEEEKDFEEAHNHEAPSHYSWLEKDDKESEAEES